MKPSLKWAAISVGSIVAIAHVGLLGYVVRQQPKKIVEVPTINIPHGPYSSYKIEAGNEGYSIEYRANDPKVLESQRSLDLNKSSSGFFGGKKSEIRSEHRQDQYTMEGTRNMGGGEIGEVGKIGGVSAECIAADAGARSQGAMAGTSIVAGLAVPAVATIPYIGWLASGWALLLGQNIGSEAGSQVNSLISDC